MGWRGGGLLGLGQLGTAASIQSLLAVPATNAPAFAALMRSTTESKKLQALEKSAAKATLRPAADRCP